MNETITFVTAVNNLEVYKNNFLASKIFSGDHRHEILVQQAFPSAAKAFNDAIDRTKNDLMIFAHQDVVFPEYWLDDLENALGYLADEDPLWGVPRVLRNNKGWAGCRIFVLCREREDYRREI